MIRQYCISEVFKLFHAADPQNMSFSHGGPPKPSNSTSQQFVHIHHCTYWNSDYSDQSPNYQPCPYSWVFSV